MRVDIDALIAPLADESGERAGPDLGYSNERAEIEAPFQLDANGGEVDERGWRESIRLIRAQAQETRDLWLAVYLARAGAKVGDLGVVAEGTAMLAGLLELLWDEVHPTLDEADFVGRKTPCDSLTKIREFLAPLRRATVFEHRQGKVSGEDLERFATEGAAADGYPQFRNAIATDDPERQAEIDEAFAMAVQRLDAIRDAIARVDEVLVANAGSDTGTNFRPTYDALASLRAVVVPYAGLDGEEPMADAAAPGSGAVQGASALAGGVNSREDVVRAIDAITAYYKAREPGHPMPVLMDRARAWVGMGFLELLDDLSPDSGAEAKRVLVSRPVESDY